MATKLCFCLVVTFNSVVSLSTSGKLFVASCPWEDKDRRCSVTIIPEEITTIVIRRKEGDSITTIKALLAYQYKAVQYSLSKSEDKQDQMNACTPSIKHPVFIFKSYTKFRVILLTQNENMNFDFALLIPKDRCSSYYFTVSANAYPFISIVSFDFPETYVELEFQKNPNSFSIDCFADQNCTSNKKVYFLMKSYSCWYFVVNDETARLHNTVIISRLPVYVISGSFRGSDGKDAGLYHTSITSLKPVSSWGKSYIVPVIPRASRSFVISTLTSSFSVVIRDGHKKQILQIADRDLPKVYRLDSTTYTCAVTADHPFGLYQFLSAGDNHDSSIVNLIPVELWMPGVLHVDAVPLDFRTHYVLIARGSRKHVILPPALKKSNTFRWVEPDLSVDGFKYCVAEFHFPERHARLYMDSEGGKMMLYVAAHRVGSIAWVVTAHPHDFYVSEIYQTGCKADKNMSQSDGRDNDCDGSIDEEMKDGIDNDGDGRIDEDVTETYSDGEWGDWSHVCNSKCNNTIYAVRSRTCMDRSTFGADCVGERMQCNMQTCPTDCVATTHPDRHCFCKVGCSTCEANLFECKLCDGELRNSDECLKQCPSGIFSQCKPSSVYGITVFLYVVPAILVVTQLFAMAKCYQEARRKKEEEDNLDVPMGPVRRFAEVNRYDLSDEVPPEVPESDLDYPGSSETADEMKRGQSFDSLGRNRRVLNSMAV